MAMLILAYWLRSSYSLTMRNVNNSITSLNFNTRSRYSLTMRNVNSLFTPHCISQVKIEPFIN